MEPRDVFVTAKQVFTYLKLKELKLGFVLNFGSNLMKEGIERIVNGLGDVNLGVFGSLRDQLPRSEPDGIANKAALQG